MKFIGDKTKMDKCLLFLLIVLSVLPFGLLIIAGITLYQKRKANKLPKLEVVPEPVKDYKTYTHAVVNPKPKKKFNRNKRSTKNARKN